MNLCLFTSWGFGGEAPNTIFLIGLAQTGRNSVAAPPPPSVTAAQAAA